MTKRYTYNGPDELLEGMRCRSLWSAVLTQAIRDNRDLNNQKGSWFWDGVGERYANVAKSKLDNWFTSKLYKVGSFLWICDVLDMNPDHVLKVKDSITRKQLV